MGVMSDEAVKGLSADLEPLLASLARLFAAEGKAREVAILANALSRIEETGYDNWNGGTYSYTIFLEIPPHLDVQIASSREEIQNGILEKAQLQTRGYGHQGIEAVIILAELKADTEWRTAAKQWVGGNKINNQGRVRSDNVASRQCDGLLFRSEPEVFLYRAFKMMGVTFAPLPVFIRGGNGYKRIEPDFIVIKDGIMLMVEVDGDTVHHETPLEAHNRTAMMAHEGVHVERVRAADCSSLEAAEFVAERLIGVVARIKASR
jgi:hypothetical protein